MASSEPSERQARLSTVQNYQQLHTPPPSQQPPPQLPEHRARKDVPPAPEAREGGPPLAGRKYAEQGLAGAVGLARPEDVERRAGRGRRGRESAPPPRGVGHGRPQKLVEATVGEVPERIITQRRGNGAPLAPN